MLSHTGKQELLTQVFLVWQSRAELQEEPFLPSPYAYSHTVLLCSDPRSGETKRQNRLALQPLSVKGSQHFPSTPHWS